MRANAAAQQPQQPARVYYPNYMPRSSGSSGSAPSPYASPVAQVQTNGQQYYVQPAPQASASAPAPYAFPQTVQTSAQPQYVQQNFRIQPLSLRKKLEEAATEKDKEDLEDELLFKALATKTL